MVEEAKKAKKNTGAKESNKPKKKTEAKVSSRTKKSVEAKVSSRTKKSVEAKVAGKTKKEAGAKVSSATRKNTGTKANSKTEKKTVAKKADEAKASKESKVSKETKTTQKETKKSSKKVWIWICSVVGGVAVVGLATWGIITMILENEPLPQDWAQTYYVYLDENPLEPELKDSEGKTVAEADKYEVGFYDVEGIEEPVMAVNYVDDDKNYVSYYWADVNNGTNGVSRAFVFNPSKIELLYNIEEEKNDYYIHYEEDKTDYYKKLSDEILKMRDAENPDKVKSTPEYKFKEDDKVSVTDKDGKEHSMTKFEQTFVEVEDDNKPAELPVNYEKNDLKTALKGETYEYQVLQEVAQKHAEMIKRVVEDIKKRKNEIASVEKENAEIEAAKKAEEERKRAEEEQKRAEEEAKKGIQLEGKTISYGTYLMDDSWVGPEYASQHTLVLKPNGVCTYGGKPCTYTFGQRDFAQDASSNGRDVHKSIIISTSDSYETSLFAYRNNELGDGDIEYYVYAGY